MGTTLTGTQINNTYSGLLKTTDNAAIGAGVKTITDGAGNDSPLGLSSTVVSVSGVASTLNVTAGSAQIASNGISIQNAGLTDGMYVTGTGVAFGGAVDFSSATVTGLPAGAPGLVAGSIANSIASAAHLTTTAATSDSAGNIAIGDNARAIGGGGFLRGNIAIGQNTQASSEKDIAIGVGASATGSRGIAMGENAASGFQSIALGMGADAPDAFAVAIGRNSDSGAASAVAIGDYAGYLGPFAATNAVMIGHDNGFSAGANSISLGFNCTAKATDAIAIGNDARVDSSAHTAAVVIGEDTRATAAGAVALGRNITAAKADTTSVAALETQTASTPTAGGIVMVDAGSTERRINIDASGNLQIDSTPVGGGGGGVVGIADTTKTAHSGPDTADTIIHSMLIPAGTFTAGDVLQFNALTDHDVSGGGWIYASWWIHTNNTTVYGGAGFSQIQSPTDGTGMYLKNLYIHTADGTGDGTTVAAATLNTDAAQMSVYSGDPIATYAIDWTVDQYINALVYVDNAGSTYTVHGMSITKQNS